MRTLIVFLALLAPVSPAYAVDTCAPNEQTRRAILDLIDGLGTSRNTEDQARILIEGYLDDFPSRADQLYQRLLNLPGDQVNLAGEMLSSYVARGGMVMLKIPGTNPTVTGYVTRVRRDPPLREIQIFAKPFEGTEVSVGSMRVAGGKPRSDLNFPLFGGAPLIKKSQTLKGNDIDALVASGSIVTLRSKSGATYGPGVIYKVNGKYVMLGEGPSPTTTRLADDTSNYFAAIVTPKPPPSLLPKSVISELEAGRQPLVTVSGGSLGRILSRNGPDLRVLLYDPTEKQYRIEFVTESKITESTQSPVNPATQAQRDALASVSDPLLGVTLADATPPFGQIVGVVTRKFGNDYYVFNASTGKTTPISVFTLKDNLRRGTYKFMGEMVPAIIQVRDKIPLTTLGDAGPMIGVGNSGSMRIIQAEVANFMATRGYPLTDSTIAALRSSPTVLRQFYADLVLAMKPYNSTESGTGYGNAASDAAKVGMTVGQICLVGKGVCLHSSVYYHAILANYGIKSSIAFGRVSSGEDGGSGGHAWVKVADPQRPGEFLYINPNWKGKSIFTVDEYNAAVGISQVDGSKKIQEIDTDRVLFQPIR